MASRQDERFLVSLLRTETVGGAVMLVAAAAAVIWANSPLSDSYESFRTFDIGPLSVEHWAADGALAVFFYLAGLEVKRELLVGSLRNPRDAVVPVVAAACGVAVPSVVYVVVNLIGDGDTTGWAIPAATDIAFALAVLAVVGGSLPTSVRAFLLTLAVVDDLIVIAIIALFYGEAVSWWWLLGAVGGLLVFWVLQRFVQHESWLLYVPLAPAVWWCVHESGIHATIAGVAMGLLTRVVPHDDEERSPAEIVEHALQPWSAGVAVPLFALTAAGVSLDGSGDLLRDPIAIGAFLGLFAGKPIGIVVGSFLVTKLTPARLELAWRDLIGVGILGGVGFTVALLVADLSYDASGPAKTAVLAASVVTALIGGLVLRRSSQEQAR